MWFDELQLQVVLLSVAHGDRGWPALPGDAGCCEGLYAPAHGPHLLDRADHGWGADVGGSGTVAPGGEEVITGAYSLFFRGRPGDLVWLACPPSSQRATPVVCCQPVTLSRPGHNFSSGCVLEHSEPAIHRAVQGAVWSGSCRRPKVVEYIAGAHQFLPDHLTGVEVERSPVISI